MWLTKVQCSLKPKQNGRISSKLSSLASSTSMDCGAPIDIANQTFNLQVHREYEMVIVVVSTLTIEFIVVIRRARGLCSEKALRPDSHFLVRSSCTDDVVAICVGAKMGRVCRACVSEDIITTHGDTFVRSFFHVENVLSPLHRG